MLDKILGTITLLMLAGFIGVVAVAVNEPDLWLVTVIVLSLAGYDFWSSQRRNGAKSNLPDQRIT